MTQTVLYTIIPGEPVPAPRPRFRVMPIKDFGTMKRAKVMRELLRCFRPAPYTDKTDPYPAFKKAAAWEFERVRRAHCGMAPFVAKDVPLGVHILIVSPLPQSHHRKTESKRPSRSWLTSHGKGDADNLAKGVMDAANGVLWHDDRQVASLTVEKIRGAQFESPRTEVMIWVMQQQPFQQTLFEMSRRAFRESDRLVGIDQEGEDRWQKETEWEQELPL